MASAPPPSLATMLRDKLQAGASSNKRRRDDDEDSSSSSSSSSSDRRRMPPPPSKRPRYESESAVAALREPLREPLRDEPSEERESEDDSRREDATYPPETVPAPRAETAVAAAAAADADTDGAPYHCLFCEFGDATYDGIVASWAIGYTQMLRIMRDRVAHASLRSVAREVVAVFRRQMWEPAVAANGGRPPSHLRMLTVADVERHIKQHTRHRLITTKDAYDTMREQIDTLRTRFQANFDVKLAAEMRHSLELFMKIGDRLHDLGGGDPELILDPLKANRLATTEKLQRIAMNSSDALGGATASGSTSSALATAQLQMRPAYGHAQLQSVPDGDAPEL